MTGKVTVAIEHEGVAYDGTIGRITSTSLGYGDHGILTAAIVVEWPGGGVSVGGFCLDRPRDVDSSDYTRVGTAYGLDHLIRIIETAGVERWEKLPGTDVIVLFAEGKSGWGGRSIGFAGLTNGRVFVLQEHADAWRHAKDGS